MPSPRRSSKPEDSFDSGWATAGEIAAAVAKGRVSAVTIIEDALARITARDPVLNSFTDVLGDRALKRARAIDAVRAKRRALGSLAGVPFAVKNLFDVKGLPTRAGSKINRELAPAARDLALAYDAMQGYDAKDPICVHRPVEPTLAKLPRGTKGLRIAVAGGYFTKSAFPEACAAVDHVAAALKADTEVEIPEAARA